MRRPFAIPFDCLRAGRVLPLGRHDVLCRAGRGALLHVSALWLPVILMAYIHILEANEVVWLGCT